MIGLAARLLVVAAVAGAPALLEGQVIQGRLIDAASGRPIAAGAVVLLLTSGPRVQSVESAVDGTFQLRAPGAGSYDIYAERLGYFAGVATLEVDADQTLEVEFRLEPSPLLIDSLDVVTRPEPTALERAGFEARRKSGIGHFLTREELLDRRRPRDITDALRTLTGVYTDQRRFGPDRILLRRVGTPMDPRPYCEPFLFLDGLPVQPPWESLLDLDDIAAVEVYPEAGRVPAAFASRGQVCGVVVVWSRLRYGEPGSP